MYKSTSSFLIIRGRLIYYSILNQVTDTDDSYYIFLPSLFSVMSYRVIIRNLHRLQNFPLDNNNFERSAELSNYVDANANTRILIRYSHYLFFLYNSNQMLIIRKYVTYRYYIFISIHI